MSAVQRELLPRILEGVKDEAGEFKRVKDDFTGLEEGEMIRTEYASEAAEAAGKALLEVSRPRPREQEGGRAGGRC